MATNGTEMTPAERVEARNRHWAYADEVLGMFTRGESYRTISRATGIPRSTVHHMVKRLTAQYVDDRYGDAKTALGRELAILDSLTRKNLKAAQDGNATAAKIVLEASRDRRRLLGLDAAVKSEITVKTPLDVDIERLVATLTESAADAEVPAE